MFAPIPNPDPAKSLIIRVNASETEVGAVLSHQLGDKSKFQPTAFCGGADMAERH